MTQLVKKPDQSLPKKSNNLSIYKSDWSNVADTFSHNFYLALKSPDIDKAHNFCKTANQKGLPYSQINSIIKNLEKTLKGNKTNTKKVPRTSHPKENIPYTNPSTQSKKPITSNPEAPKNTKKVPRTSHPKENIPYTNPSTQSKKPDQTQASNSTNQNLPISLKVFERSTQQAIQMVQKGICDVFPCHGSGLKIKSPRIADWQNESSFTFEKIKEYKQRYEKLGLKRILWGCHCKNFMVIDIDCYNEEFKKSKEAQEFYKKTKSFCKVSQKTLNGGEHFFAINDIGIKNSASQIAPGVDIKTVGGLIVLYGFDLNGIQNLEDFLKKLPNLSFVHPDLKKSSHIKKKTQKKQHINGKTIWPEGQRNNILFEETSLGRRIGDNEKIVKDVIKGFKSGLSEEEIIKTVIKQNRGFAMYDDSIEASEKPDNVVPLKKDTNPLFQPTKKSVQVNLEKGFLLPHTRWIIKNWWEAGSLSFLQGDPGSGKSRVCAKISVLNKHKKPFWKNGPEGDGRKSLYICKERRVHKSFKNELACGANYSTECMDIIKNITIDGVTKEVDFRDPEHIKHIFDLVKKNDYAFVFVDPIAEMIGDFENENSKVRSFFNENILKYIENLNVAFVGINHFRKQRTGTSRMGKGRGASEKENVAEMVASVERLKEKDEGFVVVKEKLTEGPRRGGIKFKIEPIKIDGKHFEDKKHEEHGGITKLTYIDEENKAILDLCEKDIEAENNKKNINSMETYLEIILEIEAENRVPYTDEVNKKALARGVSTYFHRLKKDWSKIGRYEAGEGFGKNFRKALKKVSEKPISDYSK